MIAIIIGAVVGVAVLAFLIWLIFYFRSRCKRLAAAKGYDPETCKIFGAIGFFLGVIGLAVVALAPINTRVQQPRPQQQLQPIQQQVKQSVPQ